MRGDKTPVEVSSAPSSHVAQQNSEFIPSVFGGRYEIESGAGAGGMGRIYKAYDLVLQRHVALKFVRTEDSELERRLLREAQAQAKIEHDYVCKIFDLGHADGKFFIAMHYIQGETFAVALDWSIAQKVRLIKQVAEGVHSAHVNGLIHRDIKPSNIMLEKTDSGDWRPCIVDFGLVRDMTQPDQSVTGSVHGTPYYMSPEQATGEIRKIDARSDVYSIGTTLYELLCGRTPFVGNVVDVFIKLVEEDCEPVRKLNPAIPVELETIVMKCLEKHRDKRYASAKELAEELGRFLEGEPILARQTTWTNRAVRKIRKHPQFSGILTLAMILIVISTGIAVRVWWRSQQQMEAANEFAQEIKYIEETLRHARSAPIHNIRAEEATVVARLEALKKRIQRKGSIGAGPGNYALGRGYMALHRYEEANDWLRNAWNEYEYRLPQVSYSLGLVLSKLYQKELEELERLPDEEVRTLRKQQLEKTHRIPASEFVERGKDAAAESTDYAESVAAFLEKRYEDALKSAQSSLEKFPWLYDARKLAGQTYVAIANQQRDRGDNPAANRYYSLAEESYLEVIRKMPSETEAYQALGNLLLERMRLQIYQTDVSPEDAYRQTLSACENALKIHPEDSESYKIQAAAHIRWGEYQAAHGEDPLPTLQKAINAATTASRFPSGTKDTERFLGLAYELRGEYELKRGLDPSQSLARSLSLFQKSLERNANDITAIEGIGSVYWLQAYYEMARGMDPRAFLDRSIESNRKAMKLAPDFTHAYSNAGTTYLMKGEYEAGRGLDPRASFNDAIKMLGKAHQLNAKNFVILTNLASVHIQKGKYELDHGIDSRASAERGMETCRKALAIDPQNASAYVNLTAALSLRGLQEVRQASDNAIATFDQAIESARRAVRLNPQDPAAHFGFAGAFGDKALALVEIGRSPEDALAPGRAAHQAALQVNATHPYCYWTFGLLETAAARWSVQNGKDDVAAFNAAEQHFKKAIGLNPEYAEAFQALAETLYWKARSQTARAENPARSISEGLAHAEKALNVNPTFAEAHAIKGMLLLLQSDAESVSAGKVEIEKAIQLNQNLKKRLERLVNVHH